MQQTIKLGNLTLPRTAGLAPMAGVADRAYRILCKEHQAALLVSEMISAKGLCYGDPKTAQFCTITDAERPMGLQLFGSEPEFVGKPPHWYSSTTRTGSTSTWVVRFIKSLQPALVQH